MLENRVDLNTVIIIGEDAVHTAEEVARLTAVPCSSSSIKKNQAPHNPNNPQSKKSHLYRGHPLRQGVTKNSVHSCPPHGEQDNHVNNSTTFMCIILSGTQKACRGQRVRNN